MNFKVLIIIFSILIPSFAHADMQISKTVLERILRNAHAISADNSTDKKAYAKLLRGNFDTAIVRAKLDFSNIEKVLTVKTIRIRSENITVFKEKSITGTLFIANHIGDIIFSVPNWAEEFDVLTLPSYPSDHFIISRVVYKDTLNLNDINQNDTRKKYGSKNNDNENYVIHHLFERYTGGSIQNVLSYIDSINYCIHNKLLPTQVKKEVTEAGKFYTGCKAKAHFTSLGKLKIYMNFTYELQKDFLTNDQFQQVLDYFRFPSSGILTQNRIYERFSTNKSFLIKQGDESDPLDGSHLLIENY